MVKLRIAFGLLALVTLVGCRNEMSDQPKFKPLAKSDFYSDMRASRAPVAGTVPHEPVEGDDYFYTGKIGGNPGDYLPFQVTEEVLLRGRERFNIYCAPCHSRVGDGKGMIPSRGYKQPPSYHQERLRKAPLGYFFDVMSNGFGVMPDYSAQIPPRDRWNIVAYIRALQLSQNATSADTGGQAIPTAPPRFEEPGSGATLPVPLPKTEATGEEQK